MKKHLLIVLALIVMVLTFSSCGQENENFSEGLEFTQNSDGTYSVSDIGNCEDADVVIPAKYDGKPVTGIDAYAFHDCEELTSITVGKNVT